MRISRILWAVEDAGWWRAKVEDADGAVVAGTFPCLAPWCEWELSSGRVSGVTVGAVSVSAAARLAGEMPDIPDDPRAWALHDWAAENSMVRSVCMRSWLPGDEMLRRPQVQGPGLSGASARRGARGPYPTVGEYMYWQRWEAQVTELCGLVAGRTTVCLGEVVYEDPPGVPVVTPCPVTHAELADVGVQTLLVGHDELPPGTREIVAVGLEDCTVLNAIALFAAAGDARVTVLHRWPPRATVPWRGPTSPPMALEVVDAVADRAPDGTLLGNPAPQRGWTADDAARVALATRIPHFLPGKRRPVRRGDAVYDDATGHYYVVTGMEAARGPGGKRRRGRAVYLGMVYGSGCMMLELSCGPVTRHVRSDSRSLSLVESPPRCGVHLAV